ncbi:MAG: retropepsin-like aspartic protease/reverse transcriptase, partial [Cyanobacteria bacterium J06642_2]
MFHDAPTIKPGVLAASLLPPALRRLRAPVNAVTDDEPSLTFVFQGKMAGLPGTVLWDSGAKKAFISAEFVRRNSLHVQPSDLECFLANGEPIAIEGEVKIRVQIQGYRQELRLLVVPLAPGFDMLLGDEWSTREGVLADYGWEGEDSKSDPNLLLRSRSLRLRPLQMRRTVAFSPTTTAANKNVGMLTAMQAYRLLTEAPRGCSPAFTVVVRPQQADTSESQSSDPVQTERAVRLDKLLTEYADVFEDPVLGEYRYITPEAIRLQADARPPNRPPFRLSQPEREEVTTRVKELLAKGWITPSSSPYGAPVLFVPKPDGTLRMCIDYRPLNRLTIKNGYPIPRIDELMDQIAGSRCFSSMDLTAGYHQLVLHPDDVEKTAFNTHVGKYEWKVLPMGLCNAPAVFQSAMNQIFAEQLNRFLCVYLDDLLIFSKSEDEHFEHLREVLHLLRANNRKAKMRKCEFFKRELKFLGHIVSAKGVKPDPKKVQVLQDWPTPKSLYDVRSFLGLANYFRRFIQGYAALAKPLTDLLKGFDKKDRKGKLLRWGKLPGAEAHKLEQEFQQTWSAAAAAAFEALKKALMSAPVLALPNFEERFELVADACESAPAVGAVLLQAGRPIAFYSRKLAGREAGYSASD